MAITHATSTGPIGEAQWLEEHDVDAVALRAALDVPKTTDLTPANYPAFVGPAGPQGATGDTGPQGLQGLPGADGATGPAGPTGPQGVPGADGADGADGIGIPQTAAEVPVSLTATNYSAATADVEAHLTGINTALGTVGTVEGATNALTITGSNGIEVDATSTGTNSATVDISINQLGTYSETPDTLTSTAGALTIPLDGKTYTVIVTEDTAVTFSLPASGRGSAVVHFIQDATGEWVVSFPAATEWANSAATDVATDANARTRAVFTQFSSTGVDADLEVRGTVA